MSALDRELAPLIRRLGMMLARGELTAVNDAGGIQQMQVGLLAGETADAVERFQNYGLSSSPPAGGDALVCFLGGNRDHGVVVAVNDRGSRPTGLASGEVVLYNNQNVSLRLTAEGDLIIKARRVIIEAEQSIEASATTDATITAAGAVNLRGADITAEPAVRYGVVAPIASER
jgi:phage baseplate assembly protein V